MRDMDGLVRKATSQHGLLTTSQLRHLGLTKARQAELVSQHLLQRVRRGVLRLAGAPVTWRQQILAACLTPGARVAASHRSALRIWGIKSRFDGLEVAVSYPKNRTLSGVTVHRSVDLIGSDVQIVDSIPVTSPARTLCDCGLIYPDLEVQRLVDHSVANGLVRKVELIEVRRRVGEHGRNGVTSLDLAVDQLPAGAGKAESGPEIELLRKILNAGLPEPVLQHEVMIRGHRYRLDLSYPSEMLAIEYDGVDHHTRVDDFVSDRQRQNDLAGAGWTVLRCTHADLRDRPGALLGKIRHHVCDR